MDVNSLIEELRDYPGLTRKKVIGEWARDFLIGGGLSPAATPVRLGDDAGALPFGDGYLLFSAEVMMPELFIDPYFAGFCTVTVSANDVYAMGGKPLGLAVAVRTGAFSSSDRKLFLSGLRDALNSYGIPLLGGHTSPGGGEYSVACAVLGFAKKILPSNSARQGDDILLAYDERGRRHPDLYAWDTVTFAPSERTIDALSTLCAVAERELCTGCRDVSNPGLLGTLALMLEGTFLGARVILERIPVPSGVSLSWWLKAYPSFGFLLTASPERREDVVSVFESGGVRCAVLGTVVEQRKVILIHAGEESVFFDFEKESVTSLYEC